MNGEGRRIWREQHLAEQNKLVQPTPAPVAPEPSATDPAVPAAPIEAEVVPPEKKPLSYKQERLVQYTLKHPEVKPAVIAEWAGFPNVESANRNKRLPHVQARMRELMAANPKTAPEGLHDKLIDLLGAKETKFFAHKGEIVSKVDVEAHDIQLRALEMAGDWNGLNEKRVHITHDETPPLTLEVALKVLAVLQVPPTQEGA